MKSKLPSPRYLSTFLALSIGLHFVLPIKRIIYLPYTSLGLALFLPGLILNAWTVGQFWKRGTTFDFHGTANELVVDGPFRISRNPIYLSGVMRSLGLAVLLGSLVAFALPIAVWLILDRLYIPSEEAALESLFGQAYLEYKKRVRRWI